MIRIDSFEYVREDDESITFDVTLVYPLTHMATDATYHYCKKEKRFKYIEDGDNSKIVNMLNDRVIKFVRENKLERILGDELD